MHCLPLIHMYSYVSYPLCHARDSFSEHNKIKRYIQDHNHLSLSHTHTVITHLNLKHIISSHIQTYSLDSRHSYTPKTQHPDPLHTRMRYKHPEAALQKARVLQRVAQRVTVCCSVLHSVLQCVAVCCSSTVGTCSAASFSALEYVVLCCRTTLGACSWRTWKSKPG